MPDIPKSPFVEQQEQGDVGIEPTRIGARPAQGKAPVRGYLTVIVGDQPGKMHELTGTSIIIGRGPESQIRLDSDGVSRKHARISALGGRYVIEDLGSTNGTWIDDAAPKGEPLASGVRIRLGTDVLVRFDLLDDAGAELQQRLYESGIQDTLTGAHNRRHFDRTLVIEVSEANRLSIPLALILVQIQGMKNIVDYYTRAGADELLRAVARAAKNVVRGEDVFARLGSDRFGVIARGMGREDARALARKLQEAIQGLEVLWQSGDDFSICIKDVTALVSATQLGDLPEGAGAEALLAEGMARLQRAENDGIVKS